MITLLTKAVDFIVSNKFLAETENKLISQYEKLTGTVTPNVPVQDDELPPAGPKEIVKV